MARKKECIYHRRDGRWEARFVKGYTPDKKKIYGSVYGKTYKEAKEKRKLVLEQIANKQFIGSNDTMGYFIDEWFRVHEFGFKPSTYSKYHYIVFVYLLPYFQGIKVKDISNSHIEQFTRQLLTAGKKGKPLANKSVKDILMVLNTIIKYINETNNYHINVKIVYPRQQPKKVQVFTKDEFTRLNKVLVNDIDTCKFGVLLAATTGIRLGETCALKWKNINIEEGYFLIDKTMQRVSSHKEEGPKSIIIENTPKTVNSLRRIPIPKALLPFFKQFKQSDGECYLLTGRKDKFIEPRRLSQRFKNYAKLAGIEVARYHMLRHTFATLCLASGMEIKALSEILGHSSVQITLDRYVHSTFSNKQSAIDNFVEKYLD